MGVTGKLEIDWIARGSIREIGLVSQQYGGLSGGNRSKRSFKISTSSEHVVDSAQPESRSIALKGSGLIGEHIDPDCAQRCGNSVRVSEDVVVSHHSPEAMRRLHLTQELSARLGRVSAFFGISKIRN